MSETTELRRLLREGTPLPWVVARWHEPSEEALIQMGSAERFEEAKWRWSGWVGLRCKQDAALIAAGISALPGLLDRVEALEKANRWLVDAYFRMKAQVAFAGNWDNDFDEVCADGGVTVCMAFRQQCKSLNDTLDRENAARALSPTTPEATDEGKPS